MVPSASLLGIENSAVGRNLSTKPKVQSEVKLQQKPSESSQSFARHLEKSREHQTETIVEKPTGKLIKRHTLDQPSAANEPGKSDARFSEEKLHSSKSISSSQSSDSKIELIDQQQSQGLADSSKELSNPLLQFDINNVQLNEATDPGLSVVGGALVIDALVEPAINSDAGALVDEPVEVSGEFVTDDQSTDAKSVELLTEELETNVIAAEISDELVEANLVTVDSQETWPVAEVNPLAAKTLIKDSLINNPDADIGLDSNLTAENGTVLPLEAAGQSDSSEGEAPLDIDPANELLAKGDEKSTKNDQFKIQMNQLNSADQKSQQAGATPTPLSLTQLQPVIQESMPASRLFVPQTQLGTNATHPNWGNAMGDKIMWMASQQLSSADIRLDPPELGSLQVKIHMQQDQATVTFVSPHPQVRELLDQQVNRLREMFAEQGLQLGHVNVADKQEQQSRHFDDQPKSRASFAGEDTEEAQVAAVSSLYLVDHFV